MPVRQMPVYSNIGCLVLSIFFLCVCERECVVLHCTMHVNCDFFNIDTLYYSRNKENFYLAVADVI